MYGQHMLLNLKGITEIKEGISYQYVFQEKILRSWYLKSSKTNEVEHHSRSLPIYNAFLFLVAMMVLFPFYKGS